MLPFLFLLAFISFSAYLAYQAIDKLRRFERDLRADVILRSTGPIRAVRTSSRGGSTYRMFVAGRTIQAGAAAYAVVQAHHQGDRGLRDTLTQEYRMRGTIEYTLHAYICLELCDAAGTVIYRGSALHPLLER